MKNLMKRNGIKRGIAALLTLVMLLSLLPMQVLAVEEKAASHTTAPVLESLSTNLPLQPGQLMPETCEIAESEIYGSVVNYTLKKGHTLSISNRDYVFSVRKYENGNYTNMLKAATVASFTANEEMTVGCLIRKPDRSALTSDELSSLFLQDTLFAMTDVAGSVHRFTVEAETIDGGTKTTRAAIFLPESYTENGTPIKLLMISHGYSGYLNDSVWYNNTADNKNLVQNYLEVGYAVFVVDNTAARTAQTPDLGCPQLVSSYEKAYEYIQKNFNVEEKFSIHARSFGTFAAMRMMQEHSEQIKCALMTGPRVSFSLAFSGVDKAFVADRFGFADATGNTYEADKLVGYDPYTDIDRMTYQLPPTFWMMAAGDATAEPVQVINKLTVQGGDVVSKTYSGTDHNGVCTLNTEGMYGDALAFLEKHQNTASNPFAGKSAVFVGDSITAGTGTTKIYYEYLTESLGFGNVTAMGVPGSCVSAASDYGQSTKPLINRYQDIPSADLIVVFMGTNDYGHETPLGTVTDTQDGTFYGTLNTIVPALVKKHTAAKIVFVTPLHRYGFGKSKLLGTQFTYDHIPNGVGASLADYAEAIKTVCANNGVSVIDLHTECTLDPTDSTVRSAYMPDGLHPNAEGHKLIAEIMESHIRAYDNSDSATHTHSYENGVCTVCGAEMTTLSLRYDDRYDVSGKTVEIVNAGTPTSYVVGYGVAENSVKDTAVVTLDGNKLIATGIGTATVKIDGVLHEINVTAAPISLLLLAGQSNMRGSEGNANQSIVCPDGMGYATYGDDRGESNTAMTVSNATRFAPSALTGAYSSINVVGTTDCLSGYPLDSLTDAGAGKIGPDSGFAYEWVEQTGEKVWIVNAAHGGTSINVWQPGTTEYEQCQALFTACAETLRKEIAAGHFTLSHMAYFWCQGCSDRTWTAEKYVKNYLAMHNGFQSELAFDHDSNAATPDKAFEFGGIIPVRVGNTVACYRDGVNSDKNSYSYHESFVDLRMNGPRVAQYWMGNNPELPDIWNVCTIGEDWVWMPDGTNGVSKYFEKHYENGVVDYTTQVKQADSWYKPTTPKAVHDSIHYNQIGYNELGRESVRNALILLGEKADYTEQTTVKLVDWTGYKTVDQIDASATGQSGTLVVPIVSPITRSKDVSYTLSDGLRYVYYDLLAENDGINGTMTAVGAQGGVNVVKGTPGKLYKDHLSELPENLCSGLNLWAVLEHDPMYFGSGTAWQVYSSGRDVPSVTIPVKAGDKIFATSFGKAGENGHESSNGIRMTFFGDYGVVKTLDPAGTYKEFSANGGYLIAPEGATAINIPMWNKSDSNEIYILNAEHKYQNGACVGCGEISPNLTLSYDDRYDVSGKTVEIVSGDAVTLKGDTLVATGIGTATVKIDGVVHEVTVEKAKINLVMIMGQSNAGNHFANATSAVTCPPGTAYWWKDGATAPVDYTEPSKGFHTPLLAELYAQSVAAGDPVKNVMLWTEGATSKNGKSIVEWAKESGSGISTAGTDKAAAMMKNCLTYYQQHSDTYEIVGKGVYWLQGESDYNMDPQRYIRLFTAMWERLKGEGMEKLAFLRVRGPTFNNTDQNMDTVYNAASAAQFEMVRSREDMFMATTLTEAWTGTVNTSHSVDVSDYITVKETYGKSPTYSDSYGNKATYADGVLTTTMKELYGSNNKVHYGIFGYGLIGADAAYNMRRALNGGTVTFVQTDSSGRKAAERIAAAGSVQTVDIEGVEYDLSFYPGCGSPAGTMEITVTSADKDITQQVISTELNTYGCVDVEALRGFADPVITVQYTHGGKTDAVRYEINNDPCAKGHKYQNGKCVGCGAIDPNGLDLNGLNVFCLGDSVTAGQGLTTDTRWTNVLASKYGWNLTNKSQGGISLSSYHYTANGQTDVSIAKKAEILKTMTTKPDVIIVWGGHNDTSYRASPLGTWDDETTDSFKGALKHIAELADEYAPDATLFVLTPLWTTEQPTALKVPTNTTDNNWMFVDAIYEGAEKYGWIPINMDLCGITPFTKSGLLLDNIHPNEAGTEKIVEYLSGELASCGENSKKETIIFNKSAVSMKLDESTSLKAALSPRSGIGTMNFTWSSSNPAVVTVDANGKITAVASGNATVTATAANGTSSTVAVTVGECVHTYTNGICIACGAAHPNLADYEGKVISVLGDSISTFAGYIPVADGFNLEHLSRYPQDDLLTDVNETWWMQTITALDCKLGINDSWRGATASGAHAVTTGSTGENAAMHNLTRIQNLGSNGSPDVILLYGGTNDLAHVSKVGTFDAAAAPTTADLTTKKWDNLADGYVHTLLRLQHYYPNAQIVCLLPTYTASYYSDTKLAQGNEVLAAICEYYGVPYVDLRNCGITTADLPDGIHPDANGMDHITAAVVDLLLNECETESGENVVHSVTHMLTDAESSKAYYKGVSHGSSFVAKITGENLSVTVTMDGEDITSSCYSNGEINIHQVTGDVVICAKGVQKPVYEDYLQPLPESYCAGTNLWTALKHNKEYYTVNGWGTHGSGKVYSVTIPLNEGDRVYATSFGANGSNGNISGSSNGIRVTFFGTDGVIVSESSDAVYAEFSEKGYLTAPAGAVAVNIPMWNNSDENELYILNAEHSYTSVVTAPTCTEQGYTTHTCTVCGDSYKDSEVPAAHTYKDNVCTGCGKVKYADRPANGREAFSVEVNVASAVHNGQSYVPGTDYGYIQFPTNYTPDGEPTRLIFICHGAGAVLESYQTQQWQNNNYTFWTNLGYAVMDMYACPTEVSGSNSEQHYGHPAVVDCYKAGYDYVMERYNLKRDGIYVIGSSMGGLSSFQIVQSGRFPVIAQAGYCPVIDLYKQAYCNPWSGAAKQRSSIAKYFGFDGAAPAFTGSRYPSQAERDYFAANHEKIAAYSPIIRGVTSGDATVLYDNVPTNPLAVDVAEEAALYEQLTAAHPCPLMIFHNLDDSTVPYRYSKYFTEMVARSGQEAKLRTFQTGGHNAWANGATVNVQGINGTISIKESQYETYLFFQKFEDHETHCPWVDPAVPADCMNTGLTQGSHCAVCKVVLEAQKETPKADHTYTSDVTAPTCTEQGYTTHTCTVCGDSYVDSYTEPRPLNILMIGNSFSWDAADFWYDMQESMTYDAMKSMLADPYDVHLAVMYKGSATLAYHATCAMKNTAGYTYTEIGPETNYKWTPSEGTNSSNHILDQLQSRDWDIIVIQSYQHEADGTDPRSTYTGGDARFVKPADSLGYLLDYFNEHEPDAQVYYYMPWATTKFYGNDGLEDGYLDIADYTKMHIANMKGTTSGKVLAGIIPVGTGIQNARTTYFGALQFNAGTGNTALLKDPQNGLQYDSQHLSFGIGRYIAGIVVAETLIPSEMRKTAYTLPGVKDSPSVGQMPEEYSDIALLAAQKAIASPYQLTSLNDYGTDLADRICNAIETGSFTAEGIQNEAALLEYLQDVVDDHLENAGSAKSEIKIHDYTLERGSIKELDASVTVRVGYTERTAHISVVDGQSHRFGDWIHVRVPTADSAGIDSRTCAVCGYTQTVDVEGAWQKYDLADHLQELPEKFCSETNLWKMTKPEKLMINHLGDWVDAGATVYSVTIPVNEGDKIYANSFDVTGNRKGIQVSFIGDYGIVKTTFSSETYAEFHSNGGYLIAPKGAVAVNIPVWNVNDSANTIYILGYDHTYTTVVTEPTCTEQGYTTHTCTVCGDSYVDDYVNEAGHTYKNGICTACKYEPSTELVIIEFVNGTYSNNALTTSHKTRLRHDPIPVKAGDQCSFSLPDGWSGYICLAYRDQNWDYTPKAWVKEYSYTFQSDMDAFVVMRKDDGSTISPEEYAGEIIFTRKEANPDGDVPLQSYYQGEIDQTIESVKALISDEPCLVFPMVSDIHYLESSTVPNSFDFFVANLKELSKEINFDFIVCLGDNTGGDTAQEITSERNAYIINRFTQLGVPYYQVIGNHDDNRYGDTTFTHEQLYENYLSAITDVVFDTSSMHKTNYYKDFDNLGIRCIFLNANTDGAYGYSNETCDWFDEAIKTDNRIIVFTHIPPVPEQNYGARYGTDKGSTRIREACENAENFLIMFSGHNHYDLAITEPFLSFTMNCQKFENENGDPNLWATGAVKPQRVAGTESEDCFDIVVIRPESGQIDLVRFGAGEDRSFVIESTHTHSYTSVVTEPTCTDKGYTTHTCTVCGDSYVDNEVAATGHTEVTDKAVAATCTANGLTEGKHCSVCGTVIVKQETVPAKGHTAVTDKAVAATCTASGLTEGKHCSVCGFVITQQNTVPALGHSYGAWTVTKSATCTTEGTEQRVCENCKDTQTRNIAKVAHIGGAAVKEHNVAPTCTVGGSYEMAVYCVSCKAELSRTKHTVGALGHKDADKNFVCDVCGTDLCTEHTEVTVKGYAATCTADGLTDGSKCSNCGEILVAQSVIPAKGHAEVIDKAIAATCTETGLTEGKHCSVCNVVIVAQREIAATGHSYGGWTIVTAATCTAEGSEKRSCSDCDAFETRGVAKLAHEGGTAVKENEIAATCTKDGSYEMAVYCTSCKIELSRTKHTVGALGHKDADKNYVCDVCDADLCTEHTEVTVKGYAATCTADGLTDGSKCSNCGEILVAQAVIPAKGHTEVTDKAVAATCTETGLTEGKHCSVCNVVIVAQTEIAATGHSYGAWTIVTAATCTAEGSEKRSCSDCDALETRAVAKLAHEGGTAVKENEIAATCTKDGSCEMAVYCTSCKIELSRTKHTVGALGHKDADKNFVCDVCDADLCTEHTEVTVKGYAATCTADGLTDGSKCSNCGEILVAQAVIPAKGHTEVTDKAVAATCTETGLTEGKHCSVCNVVIVAQTEIAATGHSYGGWTIVTAATCTAEGSEKRSCSNCDAFETRGVAKLAHEGGTAVKENEIAATCTKDGSCEMAVYCVSCKVELSRTKHTVEALGHKDADKNYVCDVCGSDLCTEHTAVIVKGYAATCTADGLTDGSKCSNCGEILVAQAVIPATGHTEVTDKAIAATCTETGLTEGKHCSVCNVVIVAQTEIAATGHSYGAWTIVTAATCTAEGSERRECASCDALETRGIPAKEHNYIHGKCDVCGAADPDYEAPVPPVPMENPFRDIFDDAYYYEPVLWAVERGITTGTSETTFSPDDPCTRGQVVTFLWREAGCPVPENPVNPFADVVEGEYYYTAVLWAVERGVTTGTSETTFSPDDPCTRGQIVTFLWRNAGCPEPETQQNPFVDVADGEYYAEAVLWAAENGITRGYDASHFIPDNTCIRAEVVTFLYRGVHDET